jgi:glycosyltransferase involved in cell wall biosynthesis
LIDGWRLKADFPLRYVRQPHAGKHVAFNRGVREAAGQLFLPFDSDDGAVPQALERFQYHWDSIPPDRRPGFSAVSALRMYENGRPVGDRFPRDITDSEALELYFNYRVRGDKWGFQRTDVLREYPFPEPRGVTFVSESVVWFAISRRFKTRFVNDYLGINFATDRAEHHLSNLTTATAQGRLIFHKAVIEEYLDYAVSSPLLILKSLVNYSRYSFISGVGPLGQIGRVRTVGRRALVLSVIPLGFALYMLDRSRRYAD